MNRDQLRVLVATIFMVQHNIQRPDANAKELLERSFETAETMLRFHEAKGGNLESWHS
jgi:hypothetical protein